MIGPGARVRESIVLDNAELRVSFCKTLHVYPNTFLLTLVDTALSSLLCRHTFLCYHFPWEISTNAKLKCLSLIKNVSIAIICFAFCIKSL